MEVLDAATPGTTRNLVVSRGTIELDVARRPHPLHAGRTEVSLGRLHDNMQSALGRGLGEVFDG